MYAAFFGHNPCFSRILFAIRKNYITVSKEDGVTILVLVEYSLQYVQTIRDLAAATVTILVLVEYSLQ